MRELLTKAGWPSALIGAGVVAIALSLLADPITDVLGLANESGYGWKQIVVLGVGMALITVGIALAARET
jgi:hypothetical protein